MESREQCCWSLPFLRPALCLLYRPLFLNIRGREVQRSSQCVRDLLAHLGRILPRCAVLQADALPSTPVEMVYVTVLVRHPLHFLREGTADGVVHLENIMKRVDGDGGMSQEGCEYETVL